MILTSLRDQEGLPSRRFGGKTAGRRQDRPAICGSRTLNVFPPWGLAGAGEKTERAVIRSGRVGSCGDDLVDPGVELSGVHEAGEDFRTGGACGQEVHPALDLRGKGATTEDAVVAVLDELGVGTGTESVLGTTLEVKGNGKGRGTDRFRVLRHFLPGIPGPPSGKRSATIGEKRGLASWTVFGRTQDELFIGRCSSLHIKVPVLVRSTRVTPIGVEAFHCCGS